MKGKGKGISGSALPFKRRAPKWTILNPQASVNLAVKLAKKGKLFAPPEHALSLSRPRQRQGERKIKISKEPEPEHNHAQLESEE